MVGVKIKQQNNLEWRQILKKNKARSRHHTPYYSYRKHFAWTIRSKLRVPPGTSREVTSAFYQLKLGHGYIKAYLHRFNHSSNARCRCGRIETTEHLLLTWAASRATYSCITCLFCQLLGYDPPQRSSQAHSQITSIYTISPVR